MRWNTKGAILGFFFFGYIKKKFIIYLKTEWRNILTHTYTHGKDLLNNIIWKGRTPFTFVIPKPQNQFQTEYYWNSSYVLSSHSFSTFPSTTHVPNTSYLKRPHCTMSSTIFVSVQYRSVSNLYLMVILNYIDYWLVYIFTKPINKFNIKGRLCP